MASPKKLNLKEHISSKERRQQYANRLFENIASRYDFFTVFMSYGMDRGWKQKLVDMLDPKADEMTLDLACGTGDITFMVARQLKAGHATGLDITHGMLQIAERKRRQQPALSLSFHRADVLQLPFAGQTFDSVTSGYALRNAPDIDVALAEIYKVLKPGGRFYSLDFGHPPNRAYRWLYLHYLIVVGSAVGLVMHGDADTYRYIPETLKLYPGQRGVHELMGRAGFVDTGFHEFGGGIMAINYGTKPR